jgi:hypothetical protein
VQAISAPTRMSFLYVLSIFSPSSLHASCRSTSSGRIAIGTLGGADLKRFKESPVFEILAIARAIIDAIKPSLIHFERGKLREAPRLSLLEHGIVEIFDTQCDAV